MRARNQHIVLFVEVWRFEPCNETVHVKRWAQCELQPFPKIRKQYLKFKGFFYHKYDRNESEGNSDTTSFFPSPLSTLTKLNELTVHGAARSFLTFHVDLNY